MTRVPSVTRMVGRRAWPSWPAVLATCVLALVPIWGGCGPRGAGVELCTGRCHLGAD